MAVLVRWWPVAAFVGMAIATQSIVFAGYDARGHAAAHLGSAQVVFWGGALIAMILWSTPRARRQLDVVVACGAWLACHVGDAVGNLRVVSAIDGADWTDEQAATFGEGLRGFEAGHDLSELCSYLANQVMLPPTGAMSPCASTEQAHDLMLVWMLQDRG